MKKILILVIMMCAVVFTTACGASDRNTPTVAPKIDEKITVEQSLKDNWDWTDFSVDKVDYAIFPTWKNGKQLDYNYAVISAKEPDENGAMQVALVFYKDINKDNDKLFECPGVYIISAQDGIADGDSRIFGSLAIGEPDGAFRDLCIGYSTTGWFEVEGSQYSCDEKGLIVYVAEHGFEIQFGNRKLKE